MPSPSSRRQRTVSGRAARPPSPAIGLELRSPAVRVLWAAVPRSNRRRVGLGLSEAQLTKSRSRPMESSKESVPACAQTSMPGGGGAPASTTSSMRPDCRRWNPLCGADMRGRPRPSARWSTISTRSASSSLEPLKQASPPSPCWKSRSMGAMASIAVERSPGTSSLAACSVARRSMRSRSTPR